MRDLTARELEVLQWFAEGLSPVDISIMSLMSQNTVRTHGQNILIKLHARNRAHAVAIGYSAGWLRRVQIPVRREGR